MDRLTYIEVYNELQRNINGPSHQFEKEFRTLFALEHPTLQQAFVRHIIIPALEVLASQRPDMRNQASHDFAVDALANSESHYMPTI